MNYKPNRNKYGEFSKNQYVHERSKDFRGQIIAVFIVASIVFLVGLGVREVGRGGVSQAHRGWERMIVWQEGLYAEAMEIQYKDIPDTAFSQPMPLVIAPEIVPKAMSAEFTEYAVKYGVPAEKMARIMMAESSFRENAVNKNKDKTRDYGLCQQNDYWWKKKVERAGLVFGSLESCFWIFTQAGESAWKASEKNWK